MGFFSKVSKGVGKITGGVSKTAGGFIGGFLGGNTSANGYTLPPLLPPPPVQARSKTKLITDSITKSIAKNIMNCSNFVVLKQEINVTGHNQVIENVEMNQAYILDSSCVQKADFVAKVKEDMIASIKSSIKQIDVKGLDAANMDTEIRTSVRDEFTVENIVNIVNNSNMEQGINVDGSYNIVRNINMSQLSDIIQHNAQSAVNNITVVKKIKQQAELEIVAESTDPIVKPDGNNQQILTYLILIIVLFVAGFGIYQLIQRSDPDLQSNLRSNLQSNQYSNQQSINP